MIYSLSSVDLDHDGSEWSVESNSSADSPSVYYGNPHARWTAADDEKLLQLKTTFADSARVWKDVASAMPGKTSTQCRTRWNYKLNPKRKRPRIESNEEEDPSDYKKKMNQLRPLSLVTSLSRQMPCMLTMDELVNIYSILNDESGSQ
jgi:hypothetical protein